MMKIDIATLFPDMCEAVLNESVIGRARKANKLDIKVTNIRDFTLDKFNRVDDTPYGGGFGMLMQAEPLARCVEHLKGDGDAKVIYLSPKGKQFNQDIAKKLTEEEHIILVCGHYEGVDERFIEECVDEELSIGDYVLTGGELGALVIADAVGRLMPGVLSDNECFIEESHYDYTLEYPQYTRPSIWRNREVPEVLISGHHENIRKWKRLKSLEITKEKRPDLYEKIILTKEDIELLNKKD